MNNISAGMILFALMAAAPPVLGQVSTPRVRIIPFHLGATIAQRLLPSDEVVILDRVKEGAVFVEEPTPLGVIHDAADYSDMAAVVQVTDVRGILVEDETWIHTRVSATVEEVLLDHRRAVQRGQRVEFQISGGEILIGSVRVKAWDVPKVERGRRYLVVIQTIPEMGVSYASYTPLLIENGRLVNPWQLEPGSKVRDPLHDLVLNQVANDIRRRAK